MSTETEDSITKRMRTQSAEFDAVGKLCERYRTCTQTAVVDDDYPRVRHYYEGAIQVLITALRDNGRIP